MSRDDKATLQLYCSIMDEIKFRVDAIQQTLQGKVPIAATICKDISYLELRMICELIALSCLVAHGDIKATRSTKLTERYQADFLMRAMAKLHKNFYPEPMVRVPGQERVAGAVDTLLKDPPLLTSGFLTQSELQTLYRICGENLHRGSLNDLITKKRMEVDPSPVGQAVGKIILLLDYHRIRLVDGTSELWVVMRGPIEDKAYGCKMQLSKLPN